MSVDSFIRFPISVADRETYDLHAGNVPNEFLETSWIDIKSSAITGIRQYIPSGTDTVQGTTLHALGIGEIVVDVLPSKVRELLLYTPIKIEKYEP